MEISITFYFLLNLNSLSQTFTSEEPLKQFSGLREHLHKNYFKLIPGIFLGGKGRTARKADNITAMCELID
jgi:hypothetical protein